MLVDVVAVQMMQVTVVQEIHVVAVWDHDVRAVIGVVHVVPVMGQGHGRVGVRIGFGDGDDVLVRVTHVDMV